MLRACYIYFLIHPQYKFSPVVSKIISNTDIFQVTNSSIVSKGRFSSFAATLRSSTIQKLSPAHRHMCTTHLSVLSSSCCYNVLINCELIWQIKYRRSSSFLQCKTTVISFQWFVSICPPYVYSWVNAMCIWRLLVLCCLFTVCLS